jgi:hypothetical protein
MILFKSWICTLSHLADIFFDDSGIFKSFDAVLLIDMQTRWLAQVLPFFSPPHPLQKRSGQLWNPFGHMPGAKRIAGDPTITVPVPVLVLGTSDLGTPQW